MYKNKTILGFIPARGGSKGLPGKNIKPLLGQPLVLWTIQQAQNSKYFDEIFVSTDSYEIAEIAAKQGQKPFFMRSPELAKDDSSVYDAIFDMLDKYKQIGKQFDYLGMIEPTSPLRSENDIDNGIRNLIDHSDIADSLVSVGRISLEHPNLVKKIDIKGFVVPFLKNGEFYGQNRQKFSIVYFPYGVLYLSKISTLIKSGTFYQKKTLPFFIKRWQNYEIDDIYNFICIESILKKEMDSKR